MLGSKGRQSRFRSPLIKPDRLVSSILSFANNGSGYKLLYSNAFITVVESAELWN